GVYDPVTRTVSWNISSIAVGDNVTLTVSVRVNGSGNIPNVANVTVNETNIGENTAINYINLPSQDSPDTVNLTITKENNVTGSVAVGDEVLYTIVVTNFGPDVATGVVVVDVLDPRLIYIGSSAGGVYDPATRTVSWNIETIAIGDNVTLTVTVKVNGSGNINNFANLTVNETNIGDNGTDGEDSNFTVNQTVNLTITKTHNATGLNVGVGNLLTFTIVVTNHGPGIATGVVVTDNLDSRLMFVSTTGNYNPNTSLWTIGVLNVGDSISLDITVRVSGTGNIGNIANVTVNEINLGDNSTGSDDTNFTANETDTGDDNIGDVDPTGNLTISKIIIGNVSTKPFINTTISISLLDEFGNPIINENIIVMIDGQEYNIITNNNGIAFLHYTPSIANNLPITAYFNGTDTYLNSTSTGVLLVHKIPTSITASIDQNQNISTTFIAALIDEFNQPLIGEHIRFILDGQFIGTAVTDSYGIAVLNHSFIAGGSIIVEFLGGNVYQESSDYRLFNSNDSSSPNLENSTEDNLVDPFNPTDPDDSINPFDPTDSDNPEDLNDSNTSTDDLDSNGSNSSITMSKTANPIALLVLSLLSIFFIVLKRR
ncbi:MAG: DUF11 domain-containing protein, partial [Methanobacteriaceae archaeon]|nr:DUF11 domain-containing protein [Candidatus Methanorudis spinitermitis]